MLLSLVFSSKNSVYLFLLYMEYVIVLRTNFFSIQKINYLRNQRGDDYF